MSEICETNMVSDSIKGLTDLIWYDNWKKLEYISNWIQVGFTFYKDGEIKIEWNWSIQRLKVNLTKSDKNKNPKDNFNNTISTALNIITNNDSNRKRIWSEINEMYDILTWKKEKEEKIIECSINENSDLLDDIFDGWKIIRDFIVGILQDIIFEIFWDNKDIMNISWNDLLMNKEFRKKIYSITQELWCKPLDLLVVMHAESKINPRAVNRTSNATALIQFMPKTAKWLWTSVQELLQMSPIDQLQYVKIFLDQNDRWKTLDNTEKLYASVFYPTYLNHIDKNKKFIFWSENSMNRARIVAKQNPAISKHSRRTDKLIDWYAFSRYVKEKKQDFRNAYNIA
jgi:hypothetical protein